MKKYNIISGGVDISYQSTLLIKLTRSLERKLKRKVKIKKIWNL